MKGPSEGGLGGGVLLVVDGGFGVDFGVVLVVDFLDDVVDGGGSTTGSPVGDGVDDGGVTLVVGDSKVGILTSGFAAGPEVHAVSVRAAIRPLTVNAFARAGIQEGNHTGKSAITPTFSPSRPGPQ
ncbi:hypothetical protein GCM10029964_021470 [Kibdelosporangium lantanae]